MTLSICECELPINSTDEPVGPKTAGSLLDVSPVVATAVHGPLDHAVSSWSGQHEAMKAALEAALDTLGLGGLGEVELAVENVAGSFQWPAGIMAALFSCVANPQTTARVSGQHCGGTTRREGPLP
jgi:hypothetical protein